jgi:predicted SnoaL-like aldol condensation-catalyzing enzyme
MRQTAIITALAVVIPMALAIAQSPAQKTSSAELKLTPEEVKEVVRTREVTPLAEDFARMMYVDHKGHEAFEKYVAENLIEHDPTFGDGREAVFKFMQHRFEKANTEHFLPIEQWRTFIDQVVVKGDLAIIRTHAFQRENDRGRVFINFWRWQGDKIVEHWDVIMDVPADKANPRTVW